MRLLRGHRASVCLFVFHAVYALAWRYAGGIRMEDGHPWDWFWQTLPMDELRADLFGSIARLHAQPPLLNLYGGALGSIFGDGHLAVLHLSWIVLGGLVSVLAYRLLLHLTGCRLYSLVIGALLALHPGLVVYEAYPLYTLPAAFLSLLAVTALAGHRDARGNGRLYWFLGALVALILLRSAFHIVVLLVAVPAAIALARGPRLRFALLVIAVCLPAVGWYAKNQVQYGFFGCSSWAGQGLWRAAREGWSDDELIALHRREGLPDVDVVTTPAFSPPSEWSDRVPLPEGVTRDRDDLHSPRMPGISRIYMRSAAALIARDPWRHLETGWRAFGIYCAPSTRFKHVEPLARKMGVLEEAYVACITGFGAVSGRRGSLYQVLIPAGALLWLGALLVLSRGSPGRLLRLIRYDAAAVAGWGIVLYATLAGCLLEFGENDRFKFMVEPLLLVLLAAFVFRLANRWRTASIAAGVATARTGR